MNKDLLLVDLPLVDLEQWVTADSELKKLNERMKDLRRIKNGITDKLNDYITNSNKDLINKAIKLKDCQIRLVKNKEIQSLTFKYLESCLKEIINNDEKVDKIIEYIKNKRETKYVLDIKIN